MKKLAISLLLLISAFSISNLDAFLLDKIKTVQETPLTVNKQQQAQDKLQSLQDEEKKLKEAQQKESPTLQEELQQVATQLEEIQVQKKKAVEADRTLYDEKLARLNEMQQTIFNIQLMYKQILETVDQNIQLWEDFLKDPYLKTYELESHALYTLADLQSMTNRVLGQEGAFVQLKEQKQDALAELANRKKKLDLALKAFDEKTKAQEEFSSKQETAENKVTVKLQGELLDIEQKLAGYERSLAELRVHDTRSKNHLLEANLLIESEKLALLKNNLQAIKKSLRIEPEELQKSKTKLEKQRQASHSQLTKYYEQIEKLSVRKDTLQKRQDELTDKYNILAAETSELGSWSRNTQTPEDYEALCVAGSNRTDIHLLGRQIDVLRAQINLEEQQLRRADNNLDILTSWFKITRRQFKDNDEISSEIKRYRDFVSENNRELTSFKDKRVQVTNLLNIQNRSLTNLRAKVNEIKKQKELFKDVLTVQTICSKLMSESEKSIGEQIDLTTKLIEVYSNIIALLELGKKEAEGIISELETKSIWRRSEYAISWEGIQNIIPDIERFMSDVRAMAYSFVARLNWAAGLVSLQELLRYPLNLLRMLLYIVFFGLLLFFIRKYFLQVSTYLLTANFERTNALRLSRFFGIVIGFLANYSLGILLWLFLFGAVYLMVIVDPFLRIIFYLGSIPYLIYVTIQFVRTIVAYNIDNDFILFNQTFQRRFSFVFSALCYITIFVFFFREAFILATLSQSELPTILFAVYSIILRTLVIFSIGKDEILSIIPSKGTVWSLISRFIDKYYYPLLLFIIALMIMSDPYVGGYSNLVSYIFWGVVGSVVIFWVLYTIHMYLKDVSSAIFFHTEEDISRERFSNAKMWYGLFVIALFLLFVIIGLLIGARIWNFPFTLDTIGEFWNLELFSTGFDKDLGKQIWFTPKKFTIAVVVILSGFLFAFAVNRYVLRRIFELLPVELGVQDTVQSLLRYLILALAVFFGFQWAGIEGFLLYMGVILASIGWMAKEPLSDFFSYFVILVQRPIQIGDYVQITPEMQGVVRQITPRSVLLRRKNSYTIIVPNSMLITHGINNWHYARNFIAFEDITFTVTYTCDPVQVKEIIAKVLDEQINILKSPAPVIRLDEFTDDGFKFLVRGFITDKHILDRWDITSNVRFEILKALREHDIQLAVPTRYIISDDAPKKNPFRQDTQRKPD